MTIQVPLPFRQTRRTAVAGLVAPPSRNPPSRIPPFQDRSFQDKRPSHVCHVCHVCLGKAIPPTWSIPFSYSRRLHVVEIRKNPIGRIRMLVETEKERFDRLFQSVRREFRRLPSPLAQATDKIPEGPAHVIPVPPPRTAAPGRRTSSKTGRRTGRKTVIPKAIPSHPERRIRGLIKYHHFWQNFYLQPTRSLFTFAPVMNTGKMK